jgi:predicted CoA-binding protein
MQKQGWRIIPVNPMANEILGEKAYPNLLEAARHERIELVNVFRKSADVPPVAREAIAIGAQALWLQLGIENAEAASGAQAAGLRVVQNKCLMVEHAAWR